MKYLKTSANLLLIAIVIALLSSCGGGGGGGNDDDDSGDENVVFSGNTSPAAIDGSNAEALGKAAGESVQHAENALSSAIPVIPAGSRNTPFGDVGSGYPAYYSVLAQALDAHGFSARTLDLPFCESGTAVLTDDSTGPTASGPHMFEVAFTNCVISDYRVNGLVTSDYGEVTTPLMNSTVTYHNFRITQISTGEVFSLNSTRTCDTVGICTITADYLDSDGSIHRIITLDLDTSSGLDGTLTFFHDTIGESEVIFEDITYGACGASPDGGSITINSADGSMATITYNSDCTVTGTWLDSSGGSGSF